MVVYHTDPTVQIPTTLNGQTVNEGDQAINGLVNGQNYYVVVVNPTTIRLTNSLGAAKNAVPITLSQPTGGGLGTQNTLSSPASATPSTSTPD